MSNKRIRRLISDLMPSTEYGVQVRSVNNTTHSEWSPIYGFTTIADLTKPSIPTGLTWKAVGNAFHGEWNAVTTNLTGDTIPITRYEIELSGDDNIKWDSVVPMTGEGKVVYDLSYEANKALFIVVQGSISVRVRAVDNKELKSDWSEPVTAQNSPPQPPTNVVAKPGLDQISLTWNAPVESDDVVGYNIYNTVDFKIGFANALSYIFVTANYEPQTMKVASVDSFGQTSALVAANTVTAISPFLIDIDPPAAPTWSSVTLVNNANGVGAVANLSWSQTIPVPEDDLNGFQVRYREPAGLWSSAGVFDKNARTAVIDLPKAFATYEISIRSVDSYNNFSAWTATTAVGVANTPPGNVTGLTATPGKDAVTYKWTALPDTDIKNYELTVARDAGFTSFPLTFFTGGSTTTTVGGLDPSTTYYARVRAVDQGGLTSPAWSATVSASTTAFPFTPLSDSVVPGVPGTPTVIGGIGNLFVSWPPVSTNASGGVQNDLVTYEVHVHTTSGFTPNAASKAAEVVGTTVTLEQGGSNVNLDNGVTYYVRLIAKDRDGANPTPGPQGFGSPKRALSGDVTLGPGDVGADPAGSASAAQSAAISAAATAADTKISNYNSGTVLPALSTKATPADIDGKITTYNTGTVAPALAGKATPADIDSKIGLFTTNTFNPTITGLQTQVNNPPGAVNLIRASRTLSHPDYLYLIGGMTIANVNVPGPIPDINMNYPTVSVTRFTATNNFGYRVREIRYGRGPYTFSFWARAVTGTVSFNVDFNDTGVGTAALTTSWQKFVFSGTSANNIDTTYNFMDLEYGGSGQVYIYQPMLETGVKASSYTPSPEEQANDIATAAAASANGVTRVYNSPNVPTGTADGTGRLYVLGDTYFVRGDTSNPGRITGQYEYTSNNTWTPRTLSHQIISSIDVGNATIIGKLTAANIEANGLTIQASQVPNLVTDLANRPLASTVNQQVSTAQSTAITTAGTNADTKITSYNTNTVVPALATKATPGDIDTKVSAFNTSTVQPGLTTAATNGSNAAQTALKTLWGGSANATQILGGVIATNTILASSVAIADFTNYVPDPNFAFGGNYSLPGSVVAWNHASVPQTNVQRSNVKILPGSYDMFATGDLDGFALREGDEYYVEAWVAHTGTKPNALTFRIWCATGQHIAGNTSNGWAYPGFSIAPNGSIVGGDGINITGGTAQDRWVKVSGTIKIPADVYTGTSDPIVTGWAALGNGGPDGEGWQITGWNVRRKNAGELIVDGAITARAVAADLFKGKEFIVDTSGAIKSVNYSSGTAGWRLNENGLEINNGIVRAAALNVSIGGGNLLTNSGFENTVNPFADWIIYNPSAVSVTSVAHNGGIGAKVVSGAGAIETAIYRHVYGLTAGTPYIFSAYATITSGYGRVDSHNGSGGNGATGATVGATGRQRLTVKGTVDSTGMVTVHMWTGASADITWDNAQFELGDMVTAYNPKADEILPGTVVADMVRTDAIQARHLDAKSVSARSLNVTIGNENLFSNSSFEIDGGGGLAASWNVYNNSAGSEPHTTSLTPGRTKGLAQRVSWTAPNTSTKGLYYSARLLVPNKTYTFSVYARAALTSPVGLSAHYNNGPQSFTWVSNPVLNGEWQRYIYTMTTSTPTDAQTIFFSIAGSNSTGWVEFDDVKIEEGDVATAYSPRSDEILPGTIKGEYLEANTALVNVLNVGTNGFIQSLGYNGATGFRLSSSGLIIKTGTVNAATLEANSSIVNSLFIGTGGQIASTNYSATAGFRITTSGIELNDSGSSVKADVLRTGTLGGNGMAANIQIAAGSSLVFNAGHLRSSTYNGGTSYNAGATAGWYLGSDGLVIANGAISASALMTGTISGTTSIILSGAAEIKTAGFTGAAGSGGFRLTAGGLQVPDGSISTNALTVTSSFANTVGAGITSIDGGIIRTGAIYSNNYNDGTNNPKWIINVNGFATFAGMSVTGNTLLGSGSTDSSSVIATHGFSVGAANGWMIRADGMAWFNNVYLKGDLTGGTGTTITGGTFRTNSNPAGGTGLILNGSGLAAYSGSNLSMFLTTAGSIQFSNTAEGYIRGGGNTATSYGNAVAQNTGWWMGSGGAFFSGGTLKGTNFEGVNITGTNGLNIGTVGSPRINLRTESNGGILEFFTGWGGEGSGRINPQIINGNQLAMYIVPPAKSGDQVPYMRLVSAGGSADNIQMHASNFEFDLYGAGGTARLYGHPNVPVRFGRRDSGSAIAFHNEGISSVNYAFVNTWAGINETNALDFKAKQIDAYGGVVARAGGLWMTDQAQTASAPFFTYMTATGRLYRGGSVSGSLLKWKKNIQPIGYEEARAALRLEAVSFDWKEEVAANGGRQTGFIAEQAEAAGLGQWLAHDPETGQLSGIKYMELPVAHNIILQEQDRMIAEQGRALEAERQSNVELSNRVARLETLVEELLARA